MTNSLNNEFGEIMPHCEDNAHALFENLPARYLKLKKTEMLKAYVLIKIRRIKHLMKILRTMLVIVL